MNVTLRSARIPLMAGLVVVTAFCSAACGSSAAGGRPESSTDLCANGKQVPIAKELQDEISGCITGQGAYQFSNISDVVLEIKPSADVTVNTEKPTDSDLVYQSISSTFQGSADASTVVVFPGQYFKASSGPTATTLFSVATDQILTAKDEFAQEMVAYAKKQTGNDPTDDMQTVVALQNCVQSSKGLLTSKEPQTVDQWAKTVQRVYQASSSCRQVVGRVSTKPVAPATAGTDTGGDDSVGTDIKDFVDHSFGDFSQWAKEFTNSGELK